MNKAVKVVLTVVLVLVALLCAVVIVGALNHGPDEKIIVGRLIAVIAGEVLALVGLVAIWRKKAPAV